MLEQSSIDKDTIIVTPKRYYLNKINAWCKSKGLEISVVKTQLVFWTRDKTVMKPKNFECIETDIKTLEQQPSIYIGVFLTKK